MIGGVTERIAPDSKFMEPSGVNDTLILNVTLRDEERVRVAAAVTLLSGLFQVHFMSYSKKNVFWTVSLTINVVILHIYECECFGCFFLNASVVLLFCFPASQMCFACSQILLGLVQFGFVVTYLSEPLVRGYTTGAAIHVIVSQLKYTFGISPERFSGPISLIYVRSRYIQKVLDSMQLRSFYESNTLLTATHPSPIHSSRPLWRFATSFHRQTLEHLWSALSPSSVSSSPKKSIPS